MSYRRNDDARKRNITQTYMDSLDAWEALASRSGNNELEALQNRVEIDNMNRLRNLRKELDITNWMFDKKCGKNCAINPNILHGVGGNSCK